MKERPILFSTPMITALLEGRKTMTRRICKAIPNYDHYGTNIMDWGMSEHPYFDKEDQCWRYSVQCDVDDSRGYIFKCPYGSIGDILWVRETWREVEQDFGQSRFEYKATEKIDTRTQWRPSIFMPRAACRIRLKITDIRVERVQDITPSDACDEGIEYCNVDADAFEGGELQADFVNYMWRDDEKYEDYNFPYYANPVLSFFSLWEKINGKKSLEANPWVWVISFEKL